ncbi:MAG: 4-(cytidine 5'-diphospho)-2-C-methyl-D-erythritol kinase [Caulobacteraceae bacterium]|nr:MAG: 4-(cytidine 5'-diphospho)-2-C-methyl-D-erythritol kinase [Caulobacteraceae bacterium]
MTTVTAFAPAKINLFLHVGGLAADGYHPLSSWMVFADFGDEVRIRAASADLFEVHGPFAKGVPLDGGNLVLKARDAVRGEGRPCAIQLTKRLPPASGLGGGSSDAAATLRALAELYDLPLRQLGDAAPGLGADVPACLRARSLIATGRGERLDTAPSAPDLHAVLVNPGVETATGKVFQAYDKGPPGGEETPILPARFSNLEELVHVLTKTRNDLEAPARALHPEIDEVLTALSAVAESRFVRMSGSGATCFALCNSGSDAEKVAAAIQSTHPAWWVKTCTLITSQ